jgi:hypothetical protein
MRLESRVWNLSLALGIIEHMFDTGERAALVHRDEVDEDFVWELTLAGLELPDEPPVLPPNLDEWAADLRLAAVLASVDVTALSTEDVVRYLRARERLVAHHQSGSYEAMTTISDAYAGLELEEIADSEAGAALEIRSALRWTRRTSESELAFAHDLRSRLPRLLAALSAGTIDRRRADVFVRYTSHLSVAHARLVCDGLIEDAGRYTTGQLAERVKTACLEFDPESVRRRHEEAEADRRMVSYPEPDGTMALSATGLDAVRAREAADRIDRLARSLATTAETRTMDQLRADVFLDLLCGTESVRSGSVHITVDLATLAELRNAPGDLAGYGPVVADIARQTTETLGTSAWDFTVTHPDSSMPLADGTTRRRPNASQMRRARAAGRCVAPGCRMPAVDCDLDHITPWADSGVTESEELAPLCRHDHTTRHRTGWSYRRRRDGDFIWTSPLGHVYTTSGRDP